MLRHIWFGCGLLLAGIIGHLAYVQIPEFIDLATPGVLAPEYVAMFGHDPFLITAGTTALTGLVAVILVFLGLAARDGLTVAKIRAGIEHIRDKQLAGTPPAGDDVVKAFGASADFAPHAMAFAATLQSVRQFPDSKDKANFALRSSVPPQVFFNPQTLVESTLYLWFFRYLPFLLIGIGAFAFAASIIINLGALAQSGASLGSDSRLLLLSTLRASVITLTVASLGAFLSSILLRATLALRGAQAVKLAELIGLLFPGGVEARYLAEAAQESRETAREMSRSMRKLGDKIHGDMIKHAQRVLDATETATDSITGKLAGAVHDSLAKPLAKLTAAINQTKRDQSDRVAKLLDAVLVNFVRELEKNFGSQTKELSALLTTTSKTLDKTEGAFGEAVAGLTDSFKERTADLAEEITATLEAVKDRDSVRFDQLNSDLAGYCQALQTQVEAHSDRFGGLIDKSLSEAARLATSTLGECTTDIARTAENFDALHGAIENLVTLITPILHQVMENQESLMTSLDSDASASKAIGRASSEMSAAAQASRETVERFIALAERMREVSNTLNASAKASGAGGAVQRRSTGTRKRISQAVRDLRSAANETSGGLPDLGDD